MFPGKRTNRCRECDHRPKTIQRDGKELSAGEKGKTQNRDWDICCRKLAGSVRS